MNNLKVWPHLAIVALVCAVAAGVGVGLWMKHEQTASAESIPNAARIQRVEGQVALNNSEAVNTQSDQWIAATENQPFSVGDRIYTRDNSRASLAFGTKFCPAQSKHIARRDRVRRRAHAARVA